MPNYKSKTILHGNLNSNRNRLSMGFTNWCNYFWNEKQKEELGIPTIVKEWNSIHREVNNIKILEIERTS